MPALEDPPSPRPPAWFRLFPFLKAPSDLTAQQWRLLGLLGVTVLINHYDFGILGAALLQIQQGLDVPEQQIGSLVGAVRLGSVPALLLAMVADRVGRRRLLLFTILGFTACTTLTAAAQTAAQFLVLQFLARAFVTAEEILAVVIIAEELGANRRGFGLGVLAALGSLGNGLAFIAFGFIEMLPFGWRALYLVGVVPLLLIAWIRRRLPETRRFEAERERRRDAGSLASLFQPGRDLLRVYPGRAAALFTAVLLSSMLVITAATFPVKFLQQTHGWTPGMIPVLMVGGGILVFASMAVSGIVADRIGRRRLAVAALVLNAGGVAIFYNGAGWWVVPGWILMTSGLVSADVIFGALGSELFPTSYRSTASGLRALAWTLGGALGLFIEGSWLWPLAGTHAAAITWMLAGAWIAPLVVLGFLPETARRELEEIAPD
jgi:MFS family permease